MNMTLTKHNTLVLSIAAGLSILIFFIDKKEKELVFTSRVFPCISGWGYDILVNDKLFIHQESVPVLSGEKGFPKKDQADQAAQLIINKMKQGRAPTLTTFELHRIFASNETKYGQPGKY
jgi:hypothetical protein